VGPIQFEDDESSFKKNGKNLVSGSALVGPVFCLPSPDGTLRRAGTHRSQAAGVHGPVFLHEASISPCGSSDCKVCEGAEIFHDDAEVYNWDFLNSRHITRHHQYGTVICMHGE
jgi:hypothetical protein